jgi:hypothetical protein
MPFRATNPSIELCRCCGRPPGNLRSCPSARPPGPRNRFFPPASAARPPAQTAYGSGSDRAQSPQSADSLPRRTGSVEEEIDSL